MKQRHGFVSNSSSSSFCVVMPDNFNVDGFIKKHFTTDPDYPSIVIYDGDEMEHSTLVKILEDLKEGTGFGIFGNPDIFRTLSTLLEPYIIASWDTGPDDGSIESTSLKDLMKLIEKIKVLTYEN